MQLYTFFKILPQALYNVRIVIYIIL